MGVCRADPRNAFIRERAHQAGQPPRGHAVGIAKALAVRILVPQINDLGILIFMQPSPGRLTIERANGEAPARPLALVAQNASNSVVAYLRPS